MSDRKFLAIKNWDKFQPKDTKNSPWIRDYKDKDFDPDYIQLTIIQRHMLDAVCRLRGRYGRCIPNDPLWIVRATAILPRERHNATTAIQQLINSGFLILCNEQNEPIDKYRKEEKSIDKGGKISETKSPPSAVLKEQDLSPMLLQQMGMGMGPQTTNATIEAIRVKGGQPDWDCEKATLHIIERWNAYKASPIFKTPFKKGPVKWLIEGNYDDPAECWQGKQESNHAPPPSQYVSGSDLAKEIREKRRINGKPETERTQ